MSNYQKRKEAARQEAIDWQLNDSDYPYIYERFLISSYFFYVLGKRF